MRADAKAAGDQLRRLGITVTLAPVGDVPTVAGAALAGRAFSEDPQTAAAAMADAVAGWRAAGVASTAKHFPGLGGATVNTDDGPATVDRSRAELEADDLPPFAAAIDAGVPLVMIGHASYPALDPDRIASQSAPIIEDLLRRELGFRGVVVTDSMEAAGVAGHRRHRHGLRACGPGRRRPAAPHRAGLVRPGQRAPARARPPLARVPRARARGGRPRARAQGARRGRPALSRSRRYSPP